MLDNLQTTADRSGWAAAGDDRKEFEKGVRETRQIIG